MGLPPNSGRAPTISIAMCTYNGARYLEEQLESILRQSRPPDELVACDDGSTDETLPILAKFAADSPFPTRIYRNETNLGFTRNFEKAIQLCSGDLIALCDQDDLWYPEKLARLERYFRDDPDLGGVFSDGELIDSSSQRTGPTLWSCFGFDEERQALIRAGNATEVLLKSSVVTGMTMVFRRELKEVFLPIPAAWPHDGWIAWMLALFSKMEFCPEPLVGYRTHSDQQLGVPLSFRQKLDFLVHHGVKRYLQQIKSYDLRLCEAAAAQFESLAHYLESTPASKFPTIQSQAEDRATHFRNRIAVLKDKRIRRPAPVLRSRSQYAKYYMRPLRTMFTDLIA